jgi:hypothetical protein
MTATSDRTPILRQLTRAITSTAASEEDFRRRAPGRTVLDTICQLEQTRVLSNDWVVQY